MKKTNSASQHTRQKIKDAFIELCAENGLANVTVSQITKRSGCNRCTFYNYYENTDTLLKDIEDAILEQYKKQYAEIFANGLPSNYEIVLTHDADRADIRQAGKVLPDGSLQTCLADLLAENPVGLADNLKLLRSDLAKYGCRVPDPGTAGARQSHLAGQALCRAGGPHP